MAPVHPAARKVVCADGCGWRSKRIPAEALTLKPGGMSGRPQVWKPCPSCGGDVRWLNDSDGQFEKQRPTFRIVRTWNPDRDPAVRECRKAKRRRAPAMARLFDEARRQLDEAMKDNHRKPILVGAAWGEPL